ncbi:MAG: hypothetical protein JSW58_12775 [Candidatus Latescibacterota bacterium]|nr:MAG: hypothetical protein JSW58_12775 [Candidatus Latescibacterota bacterium]
MKYVMLVVLAVLTALVYLPAAQEDDTVPWVDIRADSITFGFPAPDSIRLTAHYTFFSHMPMDTIIVSDIGFFLDDAPVYGEPIDVTRSYNNCHVFKTEAECKGECYYSSVPPIEIGECVWNEAFGPPGDTIPGTEWCACEKKAQKSCTVHYSGEDFASFELDPGNMVEEPDESNNSVSVNVTGVAVKPSTWGRIKALFDEE